jgi:hypothetical protein
MDGLPLFEQSADQKQQSQWKEQAEKKENQKDKQGVHRNLPVNLQLIFSI